MSDYQQEVAGMTNQQRQNAATEGFTTINNLLESETVLLGFCSAAKLYDFNIQQMGQINQLNNLSQRINEAAAMDQTEQFNKGLEAFFNINYLPTQQRNAVFKGVFASAALGNVDVRAIAARAVPEPGPKVGPAEPVW